VAPTLATQTVGVIGSGIDEHDDLARAVGHLLARLGVNLLTGGGGGVMTAVSRAYVSQPRRDGICIGIIPCRSEQDRARPKPGYPNPFVELPIFTHLPRSGREGTDDLSRNHINILSCAAIVALPGEHGTVSEVLLAIRYRKPIVMYASDPALVAQFPDSVERLEQIDAVERFLRRHVSVSR
jgi:uncharacterized protein (TIGR00725 family)